MEQVDSGVRAMAKTASKHRSEIEFLKGEIRRLKKQLRKLLKTDNPEVLEKYGAEEDVEEYMDENRCPACERGVLVTIDLVHIEVTSCSVCDYQVRKRKNG